MKRTLLACLASLCAVSAFGQEYSAKPLIEGSWTRKDGKALLIQHFQNGRFFASRIDPSSKVMLRNSCGEYAFNVAGKQEGWIDFTISTKFATKDWEHYIGESPRSYPLKFEGGIQIRQMSSASPPPLDTWEKRPVVGKESNIDGTWQMDGGLRTLMIKTYWQGRVYTELVDTGTGKIKGGSIGTFTTEPGKMTETVEFATQEWKSKIGKSEAAEVSTDNGSLIFKDKRGMTQKWDPVPTK